MSRGSRLAIALLLAAACGDAPKPTTPVAAAPPAEAKPAAPAPATAPAQPPAQPPAPAQPFDAVGEAVGSYRVGAAIAPSLLKAGAKAVVVVTIEMTRPDVHVQKEFPLKVSLAASRGLKLAKASVGHADALDPAAPDRQWNVPVTAVGKGAQKVAVAFRFAICKETEPAWCVVRNDTLTAAAEVR